MSSYFGTSQPIAHQCYVTHRHVRNEKTSFNPFPDKAKKECQTNFENLKTYELFIYGAIYYTTNLSWS
jgi:hypothetical protein